MLTFFSKTFIFLEYRNFELVSISKEFIAAATLDNSLNFWNSATRSKNKIKLRRKLRKVRKSSQCFTYFQSVLKNSEDWYMESSLLKEYLFDEKFV